MVRSILVPLDGSRFAEQALPTASAVARRTGARVWLVRAHVPVPLEAVPGGEAVIDAEIQRAESAGRRGSRRGPTDTAGACAG